jgi:hypothetical protein
LVFARDGRAPAYCALTRKWSIIADENDIVLLPAEPVCPISHLGRKVHALDERTNVAGR